MTNIFQKLSFVATTTVLSLSVINANPVNAASISYDFEVSPDFGPLVGETYSGFFEFDDSALTGIGEEFLSVSDLSFNFPGFDSGTDGLSDPEAVFLDGDLLGLSFSADDFSFIPGFFDLSESYLGYDIESGAGAADITYTLRQESPVSTPEPTAVFSLLALGAAGCSGVLKKRK